MTDRDTSRDHAVLEAQRQRSNVYAFRKTKWGDPRGSMRGQWTPSVQRKPAGGLLTIGIVAVLSVLALALWLG